MKTASKIIQYKTISKSSLFIVLKLYTIVIILLVFVSEHVLKLKMNSRTVTSFAADRTDTVSYIYAKSTSIQILL